MIASFAKIFSIVGVLVSSVVSAIPSNWANCDIPAVAFEIENAVVTKTATGSQARRALLVGIGLYEVAGRQLLRAGSVVQLTSVSSRDRPETARRFRNLLGPSADIAGIREVLADKYGFNAIRTLLDQEATRSAILDGIKGHLIDAASPGDVCVFYYAGHGSRVKNSKGGEIDGYDEAIVPADAGRGAAAAIRDKELARLFIQALNKGVRLTAVFDSCYSGSVGRGEGYPLREATRTVAPFEADVAEEPGFPYSPEELGALVMSAAQDYQEAAERPYNGIWRGNFSCALLKVLKQPSVTVNEPADLIFQRVTAFMRGNGVRHLPVLGGRDDRRKAPLFGQPAEPAADTPSAVLVGVRDKTTVELQGGPAMGLSKGCELRNLPGTYEGREVRLRVSEVRGINRSEATVTEGSTEGLKSGDLFVVDRWVTAEEADLRLWIPPAVGEGEMKRITQEAESIRAHELVEWVDDPTISSPHYVVQLNRDGWQRLVAPGGVSEALGSKLVTSRVTTGVTRRAPLFINIPPSAGIRQAIRIGAGSSRLAIDMTSSPEQANYILVGRIIGQKVEYAWVRPGVTADAAKKRIDPLPVRSDWVAASAWSADSAYLAAPFSATSAPDAVARIAAVLEEYAVTLCRIRAWLQIQGGPADAFPYSVALREAGSERIIRDGDVREGVKYDLVLVANEEAIERLEKESRYMRQRKVYVFAIDSHGNSYLLFNRNGDIENRFPIDPYTSPANQPKVIPLGDPGMIEMQPPFGIDTYVLLTTDENIPDPYILEFDGIRTRGRTRGEDPLLAKLLYAVGTGSRAPRAVAPVDWSIDRTFIRSVGKHR